MTSKIPARENRWIFVLEHSTNDAVFDFLAAKYQSEYAAVCFPWLQRTVISSSKDARQVRCRKANRRIADLLKYFWRCGTSYTG